MIDKGIGRTSNLISECISARSFNYLFGGLKDVVELRFHILDATCETQHSAGLIVVSPLDEGVGGLCVQSDPVQGLISRLLNHAFDLGFREQHRCAIAHDWR